MSQEGEEKDPGQQCESWRAPRTGAIEQTQIVAEQEKPVDLASLPIIDSGKLTEVMSEHTTEPRFVQVQTDKVVARPFADPKLGWNVEFDARKGRIDQIATGLKSQDPKVAERVFNYNNPKDRIKLSAIRGPAGPIYAVEDGNHRVAACKLAGLETIPAEVKDQVYPQINPIRDKASADLLQRKIDLGMIDGNVQTVKTTTGEDAYQITVRSEVLPWVRVSSQSDLINLSRLYEKTYPGSLDDLKIPRDALVDQVANNFFMSGQWESWESQFANKPRDERGIVIY